MKILTVCSQGNKRSVFTRNILHHDHDVISLGISTAEPETIEMLCKWTDKILLAEPEMKEKIPQEYQSKIDYRFTIGPDIYDVFIQGPLKDLVHKKLKDLEYIK